METVQSVYLQYPEPRFTAIIYVETTHRSLPCLLLRNSTFSTTRKSGTRCRLRSVQGLYPCCRRRKARGMLFSSTCEACSRGIPSIFRPLNPLRTTHSRLLTRTLTNLKAPRDRSITSSEIKFIDENGDFQGLRPLRDVLRLYDSSTHTLLNLTPAQSIPTCRLYSLTTYKDMQSSAYLKKRSKTKTQADPSKVLKECILTWSVTRHDLQHKLEPSLSALRKGNRVDISIGMKQRRGAKVTKDHGERRELLRTVVEQCESLGREWRAREGTIEAGIVLHYQGHPPSATTTVPAATAAATAPASTSTSTSTTATR